jgi:hypothetical protein
VWSTFPAAAVFVAATASAAPQSSVDERSATAFLREVQRDVARDDRRALSALVKYPLVVTAGGVRIPIKDAEAFVQSYDLMFTPAMKVAIAKATSPSTLSALRMEQIGGAIRITGMTVPLAATPPAPAAAARRPARGEPQRLFLDVGRIQRAGALASGARDTYLLAARKNQLLELRIVGVSGRDVVVRIANARSGVPIDGRARDGVRTWIGRLPEDGEYRIEVVRLAGGEGALPYIFVISMR